MITVVVIKKIGDNNDANIVYDIAANLGYSDQLKIAEYKSCHEFASVCDVFIHYTTDRSFIEFKDEVSKLEFTDKGPEDSGVGRIFTYINASTHKTLTVDGINPFNDLTPVRKPRANQWTAHDKYGRQITIIFYDLMESKGVYEIDGVLLHRNIVTIMLHTRG